MILETERLILSELTPADAPFMYELLTMPNWIKFIGDRGIRNIEDARNYLTNRIIPTYKDLGFGFYKVELKSDGTTIGTCGIVKRPTLDDVDIGFGFLDRFTGKGYAYEAAKATLNYAIDTLNIPRIIAITDPNNIRSKKLLEKIGLKYVGQIEEEEYGVSILYANYPN